MLDGLGLGHVTHLSRYQHLTLCSAYTMYTSAQITRHARCHCACHQDMLDGLGLGHVTHLSRCEWSVLRGAAGMPRRLSLNYLKQERHKLEAYRCRLVFRLFDTGCCAWNAYSKRFAAVA
jgi:hypothetical protein